MDDSGPFEQKEDYESASGPGTDAENTYPAVSSFWVGDYTPQPRVCRNCWKVFQSGNSLRRHLGARICKPKKEIAQALGAPDFEMMKVHHSEEAEAHVLTMTAEEHVHNLAPGSEVLSAASSTQWFCLLGISLRHDPHSPVSNVSGTQGVPSTLNAPCSSWIESS